MHQNEGFEGFGMFCFVWLVVINVWKSNTQREKYFQVITEGMTKQISSSFLVIASIKASELEIVGRKYFTVYFNGTQGLILFCTKKNCHAYKYKVTNNDWNKPRKGLEPELMKVPVWPLFYPVLKQKCGLISNLPAGSCCSLKEGNIYIWQIAFFIQVFWKSNAV